MTIAAVILAAGQGTRFQAATGTTDSKLLAEIDGQPLVRRVATAALRSRATPAVVVTGYRAAQVRAVLADLPLRFAPNADFTAGLSTSLKTGLAAVPPDATGAIILLADMPGAIDPVIEALIARAEQDPGIDAVTAAYRGRRGNPVLLGRRMFAAVETLTGDEGARRLLSRRDLRIAAVEAPSDAILHDVDDPIGLARLRAALAHPRSAGR